MKKMKTLSILLGLFLLTVPCFAQGSVQNKSLEPLMLEGEAFIKDNEVYLISSQNKVYKILADKDLQGHNSLFALTKETQAKNKALQVVLEGIPGQFRVLVENSFKYKDNGAIESAEANEFRFQEFILTLVKKTAEIKQRPEGYKIYTKLPKPKVPQVTMPAMMKNVTGKVIEINLKKTINYVKIKDERSSILKVIILPRNISVISVVEGELMAFSTSKIKAGNRLEIWYEEQGDLNIAKTISLLPDSSKK